jgi:putative ABC transport system substrate-binding protein
VLLNPAEETIAAANLRDVENAAGRIGLQIQVGHARTSHEIDAAFAAFASERADAVFISSGPFFTSRRVQLAHQATRHGLPAIHGSRLYAEAGGLMSYGASVADAYRQVGVYSGRILKGAKPADMPVAQSTKFELVINAQSARVLRFTVPQTLLSRADEVIE